MKIRNNLRNLAVVIPSKDRQDYLLRSIRFWSNTDAKIYVVDGSKKSISNSKLSTFSNNIKYFHNRKNLSERLSFISSIIKEPYICLVGDDEFHIPSALKSCINFLKNNDDYVSCMGRAMVFGFNKKEKKIMGSECYPEFKGYCLNHKKPGERLLYHLKNYTPSQIYSVCKSKEWKIAIESSIEEFNFWAQMEMQFEMTLSYSGKSIVIPELMWLRSYENETIIDSEPGLTSELGLAEFWRNDDFKTEKEKFFDNMIKTLEKVSFLSHEEIKKDLVNGLNNFCEYHDNYLKENNITLRNDFFKPIKKIFPIWFKNKVKRAIRAPKVNKLNFDLNYMLDELNKSLVKINREELYIIEKYIKKFHQENFLRCY